MSSQSLFSFVVLICLAGVLLLCGGVVVDKLTQVVNSSGFVTQSHSQIAVDTFTNMVVMWQFMPIWILICLTLMFITRSKANAEVPLGDMAITLMSMVGGYLALMGIDLFATYCLTLVVKITGSMNVIWDEQYPVIQMVLTMFPALLFYIGVVGLMLVFLAKCIGFGSYQDAF